MADISWPMATEVVGRSLRAESAWIASSRRLNLINQRGDSGRKKMTDIRSIDPRVGMARGRRHGMEPVLI